MVQRFSRFKKALHAVSFITKWPSRLAAGWGPRDTSWPALLEHLEPRLLLSVTPALASTAAANAAVLQNANSLASYMVGPDRVAIQWEGQTLPALKNVTLNAVQTRAAVSAVSRLISFSAQWYDTRQIPLDEKPFVPQVMAAAGVLLDRLGKTTDFSGLKTGPKPDPVSLLLKVNNVTGSPGAPGEIQKVFPGVKSPPRIKKTAVAVVPAAPRSKTRP